MGIAFDGDGDRALFVDHRGRVVDGDAVLLMARDPAEATRAGCAGDAVVATVMSNIGLEIALRDRGIALVRTRGGRQVRDGRNGQAAAWRSAASSRATSSSPTI